MSVKCPKCDTNNPSDSKYCRECATPLPSAEDIQISHTKTLETPVEELTRGTIFADRYEIIEELGKGGMGKVYKVLDKEVNAKIALKFIKPEIAADKKTIERFRNELKTARDISHKNICRMYDLNKEEGSYYITMEYVEGQDLKSLIRQTGQLAVPTTLSIAKQVCEGLSEAHKMGTVHRDLKPSNIMIDREGNVRIMDFGIARSLKGKGLTGEGMMIGTPEYMSPEQVEGKEVDQRSDIYSLGVILYEMVTGRVPFEGETPLGIAMKHKSEIPKNPGEINAQIPEDLSRMILKCMEKDKGNRYQSAGDVLTELEKIEKGIPTTERIIPKRKFLLAAVSLRNFFLPALVVIAIAAIVIVIWQLFPQKDAVSLPPGKPSIAVLPFKDMSPQKDQDYFCDGMAESLINALTNIKDLQVVARTSAFSFKGKEQDVREIGEKLNVNTVLEGSVQKADNWIRITAQLINVEDGYHLWSERFDRELDDVFAIQDEISLAVVDKLKVKLLREEKARLVKRHTENLEAYNLYLKGLYFWNKRTGEGMAIGMKYFQQAIKNDPAYALAYTGLADSFNLMGFYCFLPPKDAFLEARTLAKKALEIDDTLAEAHGSRAFNNFIYERDWPAAESGFKRAIELNPGYAMVRSWYAIFLMAMGRHDEALREIRQAQRLDPLTIIINANVGAIFLYQRHYDKAIEQLQKTLEMDPNFVLAHYNLGKAYVMKGMYEEAIEAFQKTRELGLIWGTGFLGYVYALSGEKEKAKDLLHELEELSKKRYVSPASEAFIYHGLREMDKTFEWYEKAYEELDPAMLFYKVCPAVDSLGLSADPRYIALLKKMGLD